MSEPQEPGLQQQDPAGEDQPEHGLASLGFGGQGGETPASAPQPPAAPGQQAYDQPGGYTQPGYGQPGYGQGGQPQAGYPQGGYQQPVPPAQPA